MNKGMFKKGFVLFIIILFFGAAIFPSSVGINKEKTNNPIIGARGYIQGLIDDASEGDTIYIPSGIYNENIIINKKIKLVGENKKTTIIDGGEVGSVVQISADKVKLEGFTIKNSGNLSFNAGLYINSNYTEIYNNIIKSNQNVGVFLDGCSFNIFERNDICSNDKEGVIFNSTVNNIFFFGSIKSNNGSGVKFLNSYYDYLLIYDIEFNYNGVYSYRSNNSGIIFCDIKDNTNCGIYAEDSNYSLYSEENHFKNNKYGIYLTNCSNNIIWWNDFISNKEGGLYLNYSCDNNEIYGNTFENTSDGINLIGSDNNSIIKNEFLKNDNGVYIYQSNNNSIYLNNFIENNHNSWDNEENTWDNGLIGNYWDDFTGNDSDGDGIGDTPYLVPGGDNQDNYPLIYPWGENPPVADFYYFYKTSLITFGSTSYDRDGEIVSYEWDFGDGNTGEGKIATHKYCDVGDYDVTLTVTDNDGLKGNKTYKANITMANIPPKVDIYGPKSGRPGRSYEYFFVVTDPDDDSFMVLVDWGDGSYVDWIGPYKKGEPVKIYHSWHDGSYKIKAKASDNCGEGDWTELEIEMLRSGSTKINFFNQLLERILDLFPILKYLFGLS